MALPTGSGSRKINRLSVAYPSNPRRRVRSVECSAMNAPGKRKPIRHVRELGSVRTTLPAWGMTKESAVRTAEMAGRAEATRHSDINYRHGGLLQEFPGAP